MRIAYVLNSLAVGGTERQVLGIADRMAGRGHTVALLVLKAREPEGLSTGLQVIHLDMHRSAGDFFVGFGRARRLCKGFART